MLDLHVVFHVIAVGATRHTVLFHVAMHVVNAINPVQYTRLWDALAIEAGQTEQNTCFALCQCEFKSIFSCPCAIRFVFAGTLHKIL